MTEHPVFESMERQTKFRKRIPYYLIAIVMVWGICIGVLLK